MLLKSVFGNPWVQAVALLLAVILFCFLCYLLSPVLVPLGIAFLVAYVLDPVVDVFQKRKIPRTVTIGAFAFIAIIVLIAAPLVLVPSLIREADALIAATEEAAAEDGGQGWVDWALETLYVEDLLKAAGRVPKDAKDPNLRAELGVMIGEYVKEYAAGFVERFGKSLVTAGRQAGRTLAQVIGSIGRGAVGVVLFLANFALFAFVAGYLLKDYDNLIGAAKELVPIKQRPKVFDIMKKIDLQVRSFLRGQLLVCLCLGVMYAIGLLLSGVPFAIPLAIFGAVASFVPYLGIALTILPAILLAALRYQGVDWHVAGVIATFVIAQMIEGTILTPKIVGDQVGLNPVWVILAILVFGNALGFLGLLLAVPLAASLKVLILEAVAYYKESPVFAGDGDSS